MRLAAHRTKTIRNIVPDSRFHKRGIRRVTELLEAANVWDDLGNTDPHMLELAESEPLAIRGSNTHIRRVVKEVDLFVLERQALGRDNQAISIQIEGHLL